MEAQKISVISVSVMQVEDNITSLMAKTSCGPPARYILASLGFLAITLQFTLKVCLSVAIVAMVKTTAPDLNNKNVTMSNGKLTQEDTCPGNKLTDSSNKDGEFEWDEVTQGHILASYYYGFVATQLIGGRLAEAFGGKMVLGPGLLLTGLLTLVSPLCVRSSIGLFIACRVLEGCTSGVIIPALHSLMASWFPPKERARLSAIIFTSIHVGSLLGTGLSGVLAEIGGWSLIFYVFGGATLVWFLAWMLLVYDTLAKHPRVSDTEKAYILSGFEQGEAKKPVPWLAMCTSPPVWAALGMHFSTAWLLYTFLSELPTYSKRVLHYNITQSGYVSALPSLFTLLTTIGSGFLSQWIQEKKYVSKLTAYRIFNGIAAIGAGISLLALTVVNCDRTLTVVLFALALSFGGCYLGATYLNFMELAVNFSGTLSGLQHTLATTPGFMTPLVAGVLVNGKQTLAQWHKVFYVAAVITMLPYVGFLIFGSVEEQEWNRPKVAKKDELY